MFSQFARSDIESVSEQTVKIRNVIDSHCIADFADGGICALDQIVSMIHSALIEVVCHVHAYMGFENTSYIVGVI